MPLRSFCLALIMVFPVVSNAASFGDSVRKLLGLEAVPICDVVLSSVIAPTVDDFPDVPNLEELGFNPWGERYEDLVRVRQMPWADEPYYNPGAFSPEYTVSAGREGKYPAGLYVFSKSEYIISNGSIPLEYGFGLSGGGEVRGNFGRYLGKVKPIDIGVLNEVGDPLFAENLGKTAIVSYWSGPREISSDWGKLADYTFQDPPFVESLILQNERGEQLSIRLSEVISLKVK